MEKAHSILTPMRSSKREGNHQSHSESRDTKVGSADPVELSPFNFSESTEYPTLFLQIPKGEGGASQSSKAAGKEKSAEKDVRPSSVSSNGRGLERSLSMDRMSSSDGLIGSSGSNNTSARTARPALGFESSRSMVSRAHSPNAKAMHKVASIFTPKQTDGVGAGAAPPQRSGRQAKQPTVAIVQDPLSMSGSVARPQPPSNSTQSAVPLHASQASGSKGFTRTRSARANLSSSTGPGGAAELAQTIGPGSKEASLSEWPGSKQESEASERTMELGKLRARLQHIRERIQRERGRVQEHTLIMENQSLQLTNLTRELTETKVKYSTQMNDELKKFNDIREKVELLSASVQRRVAEGGSLGERRILIDERLAALKQLRTQAFLLPPTPTTASATIDPTDVVDWAQDRAMEKEWLREEKELLQWSEFPPNCDDPAVLERWWHQGKGSMYTSADLRQSYLAVAEVLNSVAPFTSPSGTDGHNDLGFKHELSPSNPSTLSEKGLGGLDECPSTEWSAASFHLRSRNSARDGLTIAAAERLGSRSPSLGQETGFGPGLISFCKRASFFEHVLRYDLLLLSASRDIHDRFVLRTSPANAVGSPFLLPDDLGHEWGAEFPHPSQC